MKKIFLSYFIVMTFICQHVLAENYQTCIAAPASKFEEAHKKFKEANERCSKKHQIHKQQNNVTQNITLNNNKHFLYNFSKKTILYVKRNKLYKDKTHTILIVDLLKNKDQFYPNGTSYVDGKYVLHTYTCCGTPPQPFPIIIGQVPNLSYNKSHTGFGAPSPKSSVYMVKTNL